MTPHRVRRCPKDRGDGRVTLCPRPNAPSGEGAGGGIQANHSYSCCHYTAWPKIFSQNPLTNPCFYDRIFMPHESGSKKHGVPSPYSASFLEKAGARKMYAIIETGGKQYQVHEGDIVFIEKLNAEAEETVTFDKIVAVNADAGLKVGAPYVEGAAVTAKVLKNGKGKKITVFTYKPKKGEKRKMGHRQPYTQVQIESIKA